MIKWNNTSKNVGQVRMGNICKRGRREKDEREEGTGEIFDMMMVENFPPIKDGHESTDPGSSANTKHDLKKD